MQQQFMERDLLGKQEEGRKEQAALLRGAVPKLGTIRHGHAMADVVPTPSCCTAPAASPHAQLTSGNVSHGGCIQAREWEDTAHLQHRRVCSAPHLKTGRQHQQQGKHKDQRLLYCRRPATAALAPRRCAHGRRGVRSTMQLPNNPQRCEFR
jgi:hypothetical protein